MDDARHRRRAEATVTETMTTPQQPPMASPLLPTDPPKIGDFWLDARLLASPSGIVYAGHDEPGTAVMLLLLSQGAADDAMARDRLAGEVDKMHIDTVIARGGHGQDTGRLGFKFRSEDDDPVEPGDAPLAPWVALAYDGSQGALNEARRLLAEIDLSWLPHKGTPSGPDYRLHWIDRTEPGISRLWPLPWPGRHDRAGRVSIVASWLLMMLIAMLAILLAILMFSQSSSSNAPEPLPNTASASPQSGSASPQSGSPSPSGSESGSASPSPSGTRTATASAVGSPTPNSKL